MSSLELMLSFIKNELLGEALPENIEYDVEKLIGLSKSHNLSHLVADALIRNGIVTSDNKKYKEILREKLIAAYRDTQRTSFYEKVSIILNQNGISYVPMKGIIISPLYPESWMRTSCDLDILVHKEDLKRASDIFIVNGFIPAKIMNHHDISLFQDKNHLELHFSICENNEQLDKLLKDVWDYTDKVGEYAFRENNEYFAFHHIAHMASHFLRGG